MGCSSAGASRARALSFSDAIIASPPRCSPWPSRAPPRVAATPVALECKVVQVLPLRDVNGDPASNIVVFGQVVGVHVDERYIVDGRVDLTRLRPIARCGYKGDYAVVESLFEMVRPDFAS